MTISTMALIGAPNCGKSTLFNGLTRGRAKVANYPGATVELRDGRFITPAGRQITLYDLPGIHGLEGRSRDEEVAVRVINSQTEKSIPSPDLLLVLLDSGQLKTQLHLALQLKSLGLPMLIVLNMIDLATRDGLRLDVEKLATGLGLPVVTCNAARATGRADLLERLDDIIARGLDMTGLGTGETDTGQTDTGQTDTGQIDTDKIPSGEIGADKIGRGKGTSSPETAAPPPAGAGGPMAGARPGPVLSTAQKIRFQREARDILAQTIIADPAVNILTRQIDKLVLHPLLGPAFLLSLLFLMFQAVFSWATLPMDLIEGGVAGLGELSRAVLPDGALESLVVEGVIAGVGSVLVFLPQIIILFSFILLLEASGYMARAAFMMDELMGRVGLNGRAFIPLLSSFACAIPGIMAARVITSERDRLTTILISPLMTCSARLPVYTLIIAAFIPPDKIGLFNLQGLVMFGLYIMAIISAVTVAFVLKQTLTQGAPPLLILELPRYKAPNPRDFLMGLWMRIRAFLKRAGTIIFAVSVLLWFLVSYPRGATSLGESFAGRIGGLIEPLLAPIGFNLEIAIALIPGFAAREVAVGALGTVYAVQGAEENVSGLAAVLQSAWGLPTGLAFLAWYVFAPQCLATFATMRRETNSWKWTIFGFCYLLALAYLAAGGTYHLSRLVLGS